MTLPRQTSAPLVRLGLPQWLPDTATTFTHRVTRLHEDRPHAYVSREDGVIGSCGARCMPVATTHPWARLPRCPLCQRLPDAPCEAPVTNAPPVILARLRSNPGIVRESQRVVHIVLCSAGDTLSEQLEAYCGQVIEAGTYDRLNNLEGMPCTRCRH